MNKLAYFLIPAIIVAIAPVGYSKIKYSNLSLAVDIQTAEERGALFYKQAPHDSSAEAAHTN